MNNDNPENTPAQPDLSTIIDNGRLNPDLHELIESTGHLLRGYFKKGVTRQKKSEIDFYTEADIKAEALIKEGLARLRPDDGILAEEGSRKESKNTLVWCIDPLDGTTNFSHRLPFYAVSMGLCRETANNGRAGLEPLAGIILLPESGELFWGAPGLGAWCNGEPIKVSHPASFAECLTVTGFPYNRKEIFESLYANLKTVITQSHGLRRTGSACLDLVFVAAGRFDFYYETGLNEWDVAAGVAIARGAGAKVVGYDFEPVDITRGDLIAAHPDIVEEARKLGLK